MAVMHSHIRFRTLWAAFMDFACLLIGGTIGVLVRFGPDDTHTYVYQHLEGWILLCGSVLLANYLAGSYRIQYTFSRFNLVVTWIFSLIFATLILSITSFAWFAFLLGRGVLFISISIYSALSLFLKLLVYRSLFRSSMFTCRTAVLGTGERARKSRRIIENDLVLPAHKVVAFINVLDADELNSENNVMLDGVAVLNANSDNLVGMILSLGINLIIIGADDLKSIGNLYPSLRRIRFDGIEVLTPQKVSEIYRGLTPLELMTEDNLMRASMESVMPFVWRIKRVFDVISATVAIILYLPTGILISLAIKISSPRDPVLYSQIRVGRFGQEFRIFKFRTMHSQAEKEAGAVWSQSDDPRITRIGRFLRRFRLDEIPQFFNVLRGDMSLVGPRPERPEIVAELEKNIRFYAERVNIMPGLTGWAQIRHPYGDSVEDAARKLEYDLYYMNNASLSLDLQIILSTIRIVMLGLERHN
ncbi:MAG: sugar transferase [Lentisphaerae bacterium]|nr:sugar transferase [Lentisphaerota bacterium]